MCDLTAAGVIDPAFFHGPHSNVSYLVYKQRGNAIGVGGACSNAGWPNAPLWLLSCPAMISLRASASHLSSSQTSSPIFPNIESPVLGSYTYEKPAFLGGGQIFTYHIAVNSGCYHDGSYRIEYIVCVSYPGEALRNCLVQY